MASPARTPSSVRSESLPKFASTSTPNVAFSVSHQREAVPMPPFKPKLLMPRPAPTLPRAKVFVALSSAVSASSSLTAIA
ncbi:hypothetical protein SRABI106_02779 [Rahnella aquatilis]|nr:hypothetical protein SRABI106_02779 [Rahnella aquatilis]